MKKATEDNWSAKKARLAELAEEQTSADIALVEAQRAHEAAAVALQAAQERATTAEKRLAHARTKLNQ